MWWIMLFGIALLTLAAFVVSYPSPTETQTEPKAWGKWKKPTPDSQRCPCPMINTLANHGILPHSGRGITRDQLSSALTDYVLLDGSAAKLLVTAAFQKSYKKDGVDYIDFLSLQEHNFIEHDASLSRKDDYFGNSTVFDETTYKEMDSFVDDGYISIESLASYRKQRNLDSKQRNPTFNFGIKQRLAAVFEASILFNLFKDSTGNMRKDWIDMFFMSEKGPFELGWKVSHVGLRPIVQSAGYIAWHSS